MRFHPAHPDYHRTLFNSVCYDPLTATLFTVAGANISAATILSTVGTIAGVGGALSQGAANSSASKFQARQYEQQAGQERAQAQRVAEARRREATLTNSRLQAVAAASGGSASDPTTSKLSSNIAGEGEYNALMALFQGEDAALGLESGAQAKRYEAKSKKRSSYAQAGSTLIGGAGSFFDRFKTG